MKFVRRKLSKCQKVEAFFCGIVGLTDIVYSIWGLIFLEQRGPSVLEQGWLSERIIFFGILLAITNIIIFCIVPFVLDLLNLS